MIAGAVLTLAAAVSSFILAAQSGKNPKDSAVRTVVMPICFIGFAVILAADIINTAVHFETAFDAVRIIAELIGAAGHVAAAVIMFKNNMVFIRRNKIAYAVFAAMTGNPYLSPVRSRAKGLTANVKSSARRVLSSLSSAR